MADISQAVEDAASAAFDALATDEDANGTADEAEGLASEEVAPPANAQGEGGAEEVVAEEQAGEQSEAPEGTDVDVPDSYFGIDFSDIPAEQRATIYRELQERDKVINRLMQRAAESQEDPPAPTASDVVEAEAQPLSDEDILRQFGLDPDDPMYEVKAEVLLPVARQVLPLASTVEALMAERQAEEALGAWYSSFDALEAEYGALPTGISRDDVIEFALERNILDPEAAFHAVTAGARKVLTEEATKARQEALRTLKQQQGRGRTARSEAAAPKETITADSLADAVEQAAKMAEQKLGYTWGE